MPNRHDQLPGGIGHTDWHFAIFEGMLVGFPWASYSAPATTARAVHAARTQPLPSPAQSQDPTLDQSHATVIPASCRFHGRRTPAWLAQGALALLALILLGLLLWQLFAQFRHTQADLRQQSLATSAELADHLGLNMALKAQQSLNLVQPYVKPPAPVALPTLLTTLQARLPALRDLAWLDAAGQVRSDTLNGTPDRQLIDDLLQLNQGRAFFYGNDADNQRLYLLLRQPTEQDRGYWLLRLSPDYYQELTRHLDGPTHPCGCWKTAAAAWSSSATGTGRPAKSLCKA